MVKTRPQLLVALALVLPLVAPATRVSADPLEDCQHIWLESSVRTGGSSPGVRFCPPTTAG